MAYPLGIVYLVNNSISVNRLEYNHTIAIPVDKDNSVPFHQEQA